MSEPKTTTKATAKTGKNLRVFALVTTYEPNVEQTGKLLAALSTQCEKVVVVDNGSQPEARQWITQLAGVNEKLVFLPLPSNLGIAAAQNHAADYALDNGADYLWLFDQDSAPSADLLSQLLATWSQAEREGAERIGAVGPLVCDEREADKYDVLAYIDTPLGPRRAPTADLAQPYLPVSFLVASGCLISAPVWKQTAGMRAALFIDHVDLEWSLRARRAGWQLLVATGAKLPHELGQRSVRLPGRPQPVHVHSPIRVYYLCRNTLWLLRQKRLLSGHRLWRLGYAIWLLKFIAFNVICLPDRRQRAALARRALSDARRHKLGKIG